MRISIKLDLQNW